MDRFVADLRGYTHQLKEGRGASSFGGVTLCYSHEHDRRRRIRNGDDEGDNDAAAVILRCDRVLIAHWRNFVKALQSLDDTTDIERREEKKEGEGWWLSKIELTARIIGMLEPVLISRQSMRTLVLDNNAFTGSEGIIFLCNLLENIPCIRRVSFLNNSLGHDMDIMARLCNAIEDHPSLEHLMLENVELGDDENKLSLILNCAKKLECLGLDGNNLGSHHSADLITQFLAHNDVLKIIYLRNNQFGDDNVDIFARLLKNDVSEQLRVIDLGGNYFTQSGKKTIHNVLFSTNDLSTALESNHTTVVYFDEGEMKDRLGVINCRGTTSQNMHRKLYSLLYASAHDCSKLSQLLDDVPLGLMPEVLSYLLDYYPDDLPVGMRRHALESVRGCSPSEISDDDLEEVFSSPTVTFSIIFQVMRSWNLPQLYEHL